MMSTHLIQRLIAPTVYSPFAFGGGLTNGGFSEEAIQILKKHFSFDYMGSSEFEFGGVPEGFEKLTQDEDLAVRRAVDVTTREGLQSDLFLLCSESKVDEFERLIRRIAKGDPSVSLKEPAMIDRMIKDKGKVKHPIIGGIDIINGAMYFLEEQTALDFLEELSIDD